MTKKILAVDDEVNNLKLIKGFLGKNNFDVVTAEDGVQAWEILEKSYDEFEVILLDRMMPNMDGMQLTAKIKAHPEMKEIPIIMQTAAAHKDQVAEGIEAGVYYYLTKPFDSVVLLSIVNAAINDKNKNIELLSEVNKYKKILQMVDSCDFSFRTLEEAHDLTVYIANFFPDPESVTLGISEMLINAVEHGNLAIDYEEKSRFTKEGILDKEINKRQALPQNKNKVVKVSYKKNSRDISLIITDEGEGFNWKQYMDIDPERATDNHGRGIAMANMISFDSIIYCGKGNEVCCKVLLNK